MAPGLPQRPHGLSSCAIVGSSGLLLQQRLGGVIDAYDFVMRTNLAPVSGFEEIVGTKTTLRVMNTEALETFLTERACPTLKHGGKSSSFCPSYAIHINSAKEGAVRWSLSGACRLRVTGKREVSASDRVVSHFSRRTGGNVMTGTCRSLLIRCTHSQSETPCSR